MIFGDRGMVLLRQGDGGAVSKNETIPPSLCLNWNRERLVDHEI